MNKDEEVRQKILDGYKGRLYLCNCCNYTIVLYERERQKKSKTMVYNWCIMCNKRTAKKILSPEELFDSIE